MARKRQEEEATMEMNETTNMEPTGAEGTAAPTNKAERQEFTLDDGSIGSRSAYIRQEFKKDRSRSDIAKELGVQPYIVYSATNNMYNAVHTEGGSGAVRGTLVARRDTAGKFLDIEGNEVEDETLAHKMSRSELMRELFAAGLERGKIAVMLGVQHSTVYAATKDTNTTGDKQSVRRVLIHPETGVEMGRNEFIRELWAKNEELPEADRLSRRDIAAKITMMTGELCDYSTVWAATKPAKAEVEGEPAEGFTPPTEV